MDDAQLPADVIAAIENNRKIEAIKLLRAHREIELKEAKDLVDDYMAIHSIRPGKQANSTASGFMGLFLFVALVIAALIAYFQLD